MKQFIMSVNLDEYYQAHLYRIDHYTCSTWEVELYSLISNMPIFTYANTKGLTIDEANNLINRWVKERN
jgi:hypothetical protein